MSPGMSAMGLTPRRRVSSEMPAIDVLPRLLDSDERMLSVVEGDELRGIIDQSSMLEGLNRMLAPRDDSSLITIECAAADYSASRIAHAVEDSDAHLVDLLSVPAEAGRVRVTLRVRRENPMATVRSLERYGYEVVAVSGADDERESEVAMIRMLELQAMLNV